MLKNKGYTIAEILIAVAMLGCLAVLLITGFNAYNHSVWLKSKDYKLGVVKYDKVYNAINYSFTKQILKNKVMFSTDQGKTTAITTALNELNFNCSGDSCTFEEYKDANSPNLKRQLADGTQISVQADLTCKMSADNLKDICYKVYVDTNGVKDPNTFKEDILAIYIDKEANVFNVNPKTGKTYVVAEQKSYKDKTYVMDCPNGQEGKIYMRKDPKTGLYKKDTSECGHKKKDENCGPNTDFVELYNTEEDYQFIHKHLNCNYKLMEDWDLSGRNWEPVSSTYKDAFTGKFYGQNHKIIGLNVVPGASFSGIFGTVKNAEIRDLKVINPTVISADSETAIIAGRASSSVFTNIAIINPTLKGKAYVGGIFGDEFDLNQGNAYKGSIISNCYVSGGSISSTAEYRPGCAGCDGEVGGLVGFGVYTKISDCYSTAKVTGTHNVGGLIGDLKTAYYSFINGRTKFIYVDGYVVNSYVALKSGDKIYGNRNVGGIVGGAEGDVDAVLIQNVYSLAGVQGDDWVGGIVGYLAYSKISNVFSSGNVVGNGSFIAGLAGTGGKINNSFFNGTINVLSTNKFLIGGIVGIAANDLYNVYSTANIENIPVPATVGTSLADGNGVGGLAGRVGSSSNKGSVYNSYSLGNVKMVGSYTFTGQNTVAVGGLIGSGVAYNSFSKGDVVGLYDVGGLVGDGDAYNSYATGNVDNIYCYNTGGLVGYGNIFNSYSLGNTIQASNPINFKMGGNPAVGGLVGRGRVNNSYSVNNIVRSYDPDKDKISVGGLVGEVGTFSVSGKFDALDNTYSASNVEGVINTGYCNGSANNHHKPNTGGIIGSVAIPNSGPQIMNTYFVGNVFDINCAHFAGTRNGDIINCYATGNVDESSASLLNEYNYVKSEAPEFGHFFNASAYYSSVKNSDFKSRSWFSNSANVFSILNSGAWEWSTKLGRPVLKSNNEEWNPVTLLNAGEKGNDAWVWSTKLGRPVLKSNNEEWRYDQLLNSGSHNTNAWKWSTKLGRPVLKSNNEEDI